MVDRESIVIVSGIALIGASTVRSILKEKPFDYKVDKADLRLVYKDYQGRPLGRAEAFGSWLLDKVFNHSGYYEDGRPCPNWRQLRTGRQ